MTAERALRVDLGSRSYDILVGADLIARAGALIVPLLPRRRVFVVTDENVAAQHLDRLVQSFEAQGVTVESRILPAGESTKSMAQLALAWILRREEVAGAIVGATSVTQLEENLKGSGWGLPKRDLAEIDEILSS